MILQVVAFAGIMFVALAPRSGLVAIRFLIVLYGLGIGPGQS